eukprot:CAMPEP_0206258476 /NCGR_PEP_ID=MMETSP0047_2-20121206/25941_1 /ASSEMBLY_ACC=CAM_ASM_000192 /TAXON_ID=195065 /ORGANISM="Chroomonas mesostigmatica_cf, Strain CCMP1168" /LENGTH=123 /DNA_ID=CAMNT_0053685225 /DNA_START=156 /DNA_END=524 /DNA_ORIENTATION=-
MGQLHPLDGLVDVDQEDGDPELGADHQHDLDIVCLHCPLPSVGVDDGGVLIKRFLEPGEHLPKSGRLLGGILLHAQGERGPPGEPGGGGSRLAETGRAERQPRDDAREGARLLEHQDNEGDCD